MSNRIENFTRTNNEGRNTCEFTYHGRKYHGIGEYMHGTCVFLHRAKYKWEIFDENGGLMFSFGVTNATSVIGSRFLRYCFKTFTNIK